MFDPRLENTRIVAKDRDRNLPYEKVEVERRNASFGHIFQTWVSKFLRIFYLRGEGFLLLLGL